MIPMELLSLIGGGLAGFYFKYLANAQQDRAQQMEFLLKQSSASNESMDSAVRRIPNDKAGNWIRRVIVLIILFGAILAPFIMSLLNQSLIVENVAPSHNWFGLFETGGRSRFYEIRGYLISKELMSSLIAIVSFYFGASVGKRT